MLLLVDEVKKRTQFLNTYIDNLSQTINKRRYNQALSFINQQRPAINHTNITKYNPNTFVIDSLKTKNQNLTQLLKQLQNQKSLIQKKLDEHSKNTGGIKQKVSDSNVMTVISKIQITLKDTKRIEYQPMQIESDYQTLTITTSQGKQTILEIIGIVQVERKPSFMLLHYKQVREKKQFKLWVMLRFSDEGQLSKWYNVVVQGKKVQQAKSKRYLFLGGQNLKLSQKENGNIDRKVTLNDQSQVVPYSGQVPNQNTGFRGILIPQKQQKKIMSPKASINRGQASLIIDNNNITQQYQLQKNMTNSLLVSPNNNDSMITKKPFNNYSTYRPTPLNRVRGKSLYLEIEKGKNYQQFKRQPYYNNYEEEKGDFFDNRSQRQQKSSQKNNFRKASEDITLRLKNPSIQQRKLQKFRSQRNLIDDILVQSTQVRQPKKPQSIDKNYHSVLVHNNVEKGVISGNSRRIEKQIEKKNEFLQRVNMNFNNDNKNENMYNSNNSNKKSGNQHQQQHSRKQLQTTARWINEQDLRSQSIQSKKSSKKSQFSQQNINGFPKKIIYNKENKQLFEQQLQYSLQDQSVENYQQKGKIQNNFIQNNEEDEIIEASQSHEISPTFPKKIVYEDGSHIRLYPVEHTDNNNIFKDNYHNEESQQSVSQFRNKKSTKNSNYQEKDNVFIEPLEEMQQNELDQSPHGINGIRNDRLNTLDSQTDKDQQNNTHDINESNSEDHEEQEFEQLIDELKKGLILTKCAQGSFWTRQKQIKLSQNQNTLLIIDVKDKKIKKLPISDIETVEYGKFSKGIIKHIPQIQEKKCFIINAKQGKLVKKIEFVGNNPQKLAQFTSNLTYFVQIFKAS